MLNHAESRIGETTLASHTWEGDSIGNRIRVQYSARNKKLENRRSRTLPHSKMTDETSFRIQTSKFVERNIQN